MAIIQDRKNYDLSMTDIVIGLEGCPFCDRVANAGNIIWEGKYWYIIHNLYPYSGDSDHLMVVPYEHKAFSYELHETEISELGVVYRFMKEFYGDKQYFSCTRETMANRSIEHYHMHFIPGKLQGKYLRKMLEKQGFPIQEDLMIE